MIFSKKNIVMKEYLNKAHKEGSGLGEESSIAEGGSGQEHEATDRKNPQWATERGEGSSHFLLFIQCGTPARGIVLPSYQVHLPCSAEPFWKHPHSDTHRYVSMVILNAVKLTMKINNHRQYGIEHSKC